MREIARHDGIAILRTTLPPSDEPLRILFHSRTGALASLDGAIAGAFDREHTDIEVPPSLNQREFILEVELASLPSSGLPGRAGLYWRFLQQRGRQLPSHRLSVEAIERPATYRQNDAGLPLIGHSHLDVTWLWTYAQTKRKAARTFAIAGDLFNRDPAFRFVQSQPQLYRFIEERPELFQTIRAQVAAGRLDPDVAALWVESDCNLPSGESLLRQLLFAQRYCREHFGLDPSIAWLPDSFGFANTLPQLLAHCAIPFFMTTKLQWNDTTKFPHPQFVWEGPDGSSVIAALVHSYDGPPYPWRVFRARERNEPLLLGYGDGGGGVTPKMLEQAQDLGRWTRPRDWFDSVRSRRDALPRHRDELYLEYHRGVYTTHHDVKARNALLERALDECEELLAWCIAVHAPREAIAQFHSRLLHVWEIVLRNQFHDVLPGTSIEQVYTDVADEYAQAEMILAEIFAGTQRMLPRSRISQRGIERSEPLPDGDAFVLDNGLLRARFRRDGAIDALSVSSGRNLAAEANVLTLYRDRPRLWEAWNIDDGYQRSATHLRARRATLDSGAVIFEYAFGKSRAVMHATLSAGEPFVRVELDVAWRDRHRLLRLENTLALEAGSAIFGSPHGTVTRSAGTQTPQERAKFEVPGQRFAAVRDAAGDGVAVFTLDTYGWSARTHGSQFALGHSLLRGTTWPDPSADLGEHRIALAYAPFSNVNTSALERAWSRFAYAERVRLFSAGAENVVVAACKPAHDGVGVILRVRECDGGETAARVRCGARMKGAHSVDGLERDIERASAVEGEYLLFDLHPFEIRSFRVIF